MPDIRQSSFATGEVSPSLYGRTDLKAWASALKKLRNVMVTPQGVPTSRPGTTSVLDATAFGTAFRLIPFDYANGQNLLLVFAATKLWIVSAGTALTGLTVNGVGSLTYITTPYAAADLKYLNFAQSGDVVTLSCKGYKPQDLKRLNSNNLVWSIGDANKVLITRTGSITYVDIKSGLTPGYDDANPARLWQWGIAPLFADGFEGPISVLSPVTTVFPAGGITVRAGSIANIPNGSNYTGALVGVRVYRGRNGVFGWVGDSYKMIYDSTSGSYPNLFLFSHFDFLDAGEAPDFSLQPVRKPSVGWQDAQSAPAWANDTWYSPGDYVTDGGRVFRCTQRGRSSHGMGGPSTSTAPDGQPFWESNKSYSINDLVNVDCILYICTTGGTSTTSATGYRPPAFDGAPAGSITDNTVVWTRSALNSGQVLWEQVSQNVNAASPPDLQAQYPFCSCYFEGRKVYGGGVGFPSRIVASKTSDFYQFEPRSLVPLATDPVIADLAAVRYDEIRAFASMRTLLAFSSWGVWTFGGVGGGPLTPTSIDAHLHVQYGISWLDPVVVGNEALYVPVTENSIRNLAYAYLQQNYEGSDLTMLARHMFEGDTIVDWCWSPIPNNVMWCVMASGKLVGLTYNKEQELRAFHQHDTGGDAISSGKFLACAALLEGSEYAVYVATWRSINGSNRYFIERLNSRVLARNADGTPNVKQAVFSDCASKGHSAGAQSTWTNFAPQFANMDAAKLSVLIDGKVGTFTGPVGATGTVVLSAPANDLVVGLPYLQDIEFLPVMIPNANVRSNVKAVNRVSLEVADTQQFYAGPDYSNLRFWSAPPNDLFPAGAGNLAVPQTKLDHVRVPCTYQHDGSLCIRNTDPLPMTILAIGREVDIGGD